jgi:hypothetical protein
MRYRIRVSRVQDTERTINAPDESTAIDRIKSQLDQPMGILGPWRTGDVEIEILGIESRLGELPEGKQRRSLASAGRARTRQYSAERFHPSRSAGESSCQRQRCSDSWNMLTISRVVHQINSYLQRTRAVLQLSDDRPRCQG